MSLKKLPRAFYDRPTIEVAKDILGKFIIHKHGLITQIGRIVEVEAYLGPHDLAAHSSKGRTPRTETMYGPPGHAYVYLIYGMYHCVNVVTESEGQASAVLLRAIEPVANISGKTSGPGLLCNALSINKTQNGVDLTKNKLYLAENPQDTSVIKIVKRPRVGVDYAKHWAKRLLRFYIKDNPYISKP